jgi:hypothetical protein
MSVVNTTTPFSTLVMPTGYGTEHSVVINPSTFPNADAFGYQMEFGYRPIPEPSGMLALGTGLAGLVGFFARRRRT